MLLIALALPLALPAAWIPGGWALLSLVVLLGTRRWSLFSLQLFSAVLLLAAIGAYFVTRLESIPQAALLVIII